MKLFVGICNSQEYVHSTFFWSLIRLLETRKDTVIWQSGHVWDVVRNNQMIKNFLDSDCDIFVKMDVDQIYPVDYFDVMLPLVDVYKVIGPLIFDRHIRNGFMPLAFNTHKLEPFKLKGKTGVLNIPYSHTNLFYKREVLEAIPMPWYEAKLSADGLSRGNHVDFDFLDKIKNAGYKPCINLNMIVKHIAFIGIDISFFNIWHMGLKNYYGN